MQKTIYLRNLGVAFLTGSVLAACATSSDQRTNANLENAKVDEAALAQRVEDLFLTDGQTQTTELPGGDATYTGQVYGSMGGGSGPDLEYTADLTLEVDFDNDTLTGTVDNFETDLAGFSSPAGSVSVTGNVTDTGGLATLDYTGSDSLAGADRTATYTAIAAGDFIGDNAEAARGSHASDFLWVSGPDAGDTSVSDGRWTAEQ